MIDPDWLAGLDVENGYAYVRLIVADFGAAGDFVGVAGLGDVVGDEHGFRARAWFSYARDHVLVVGRELEPGDALGRGEVEWFSGVFALLAGFVFLALGGALADDFEQIFFFLLEKFLAVGAFWFAGAGCSSAPASSARGWCSLCGTCGSGADVG